MPAIIPCPNTTCNFPGPMGFADPKPWGIHFYHAGCPGAWLLYGNYYDTEAEAWKVYKASIGLDHPDVYWVVAFDALIIEKDHKKFDRLMELWRKRVAN